MNEYTPTTEEVRSGSYYHEGVWHGISGEQFDRWFASEVENAERRGEVLATARRIASENAELMRRLG